ncbi:MAG: AMP-binding protein, partial [Myxococcales bacterium]|nr:AMP-binding protein [Myxococcales bacterium]
VRKKILTALGLQECTFAAGGAAPMPPDLLRWYNKLGLDLVEVYGMTENCGVSHATLPGKQRPGTVGLPYDGVQSRLDPVSSEIQMKAPCLMLGYYKEPELTQQAFTADGWLRTGDKGALDSEGNLKITGRVKDLFKTSKGKYVAPAPIENQLLARGELEQACVTGANLAQPFALVVLAEHLRKATLGPEQKLEVTKQLQLALAQVNAKLDAHEQLDKLIVMREEWTVDNGLLTPTLKLKRQAIEARYGPNVSDWFTRTDTIVWVS